METQTSLYHCRRTDVTRQVYSWPDCWTVVQCLGNCRFIWAQTSGEDPLDSFCLGLPFVLSSACAWLLEHLAGGVCGDSSRVGGGVLRADVGLEFDKFLGHLIVVALGEDAQDGPSRLVHLNSTAQRQPTRARSLKLNSDRITVNSFYVTWSTEC